ncbi:hypothetical protein MAPG_05940 [Magnaporthiopsis poae ATCC 64411]|uniref:Uncharacterized protein n=1 Tax=Magnaporthiopsis poae (strain ATCC 64411 / 73-15) TaxID=644358 RepID=A0A0C4E0Q8_MAGP6|nr:hypothetical protein MAPG_05940 [Magnaporthiopsis poae ATCC 64411]
MRRLFLRRLAVLALAASTSGTPLQAGLERRDEETSTETSVVWAYVTATAAPAVTTVFPQDKTNYITLGTVFEYAFTTSSLTKSGCVSYSYQQPRPTVPVVTVTSTSTITVTTRSTVTVTDSLSPPKTVVSVTAVVVSKTEGLTVWSTSCTNTLVESLYVASTSTHTALPYATTYTRATVTSVCMVSSRVSQAVVGGGRMPTTEPYVPAISRFREGGPDTILTIKEATSTVVTVTLPDRTSTAVETVCNNPSTSVTAVWYVVTVTPAPSTSYVTQKNCGAAGATGAAVGGEAQLHERRQDAAAATGSAVKTVSSTFKTIGLVDNTVVTSQVVAVYELRVQTFTTIFNEPFTVTASRGVSYVTVCGGATGGLSSS